MEDNCNVWDATFRKLAELEDTKADFGKLGIMMVGGSGAGKSALIRCLGFTDEAGGLPQPSNGTRGEQDIYKVWTHPTNPLFVVDTNGVDTHGEARVSEITAFLEAQENKPFNDRVHLIWYVLKVNDNRLAENAGLLKAVTSSRLRIPVQLVMDQDRSPKRRAFNRLVRNLDQLLADVPDDNEDKQALRNPENMAEVGNVSWGGPGEEDVSDEEKAAQEEALQNLSRKTLAALIDKQKRTWASAQAMDVRVKLRTTANIIVSRQYLTGDHLIKGIPGPGVETPWKERLKQVTCQICAVWGAPSDLRKAAWDTVVLPLLAKDGPWRTEVLRTSSSLRRLNAVAMSSQLGSFAAGASILSDASFGALLAPAMTITAGVAAAVVFLPQVGIWWVAEETVGKASRKTFMSLCILMTACILFARIRYPATWADKTRREYTTLFTTESRFQWQRLMANAAETLRIRSLLEGLWHGQAADVAEVETLLTEFFHSSASPDG